MSVIIYCSLFKWIILFDTRGLELSCPGTLLGRNLQDPGCKPPNLSMRTILSYFAQQYLCFYSSFCAHSVFLFSFIGWLELNKKSHCYLDIMSLLLLWHTHKWQGKQGLNFLTSLSLSSKKNAKIRQRETAASMSCSPIHSLTWGPSPAEGCWAGWLRVWHCAWLPLKTDPCRGSRPVVWPLLFFALLPKTCVSLAGELASPPLVPPEHTLLPPDCCSQSGRPWTPSLK